MAQHKWHKEIKAWADGAEIETAIHCGKPNWVNVKEWFPKEINWDNDVFIFRIKPQPKEPQYLYVYEDDLFVEDGYENEGAFFSQYKLPEKLGHKYIGKIKLEVEDYE